MSVVRLHAAHGYDVARLRDEFPILAQQVNGRHLAYLDNGASTQRPQSVIDAVTHYETHLHANVHRGVHTLSQLATDAFEGARERTRRFLNAASTHEIIFTRGTTEAINLVAQSWGRSNLRADDEIIVSALEHHANLVPWQMACAATGARLRVAPIDDTGQLFFEGFQGLINDRTKLVAIAHVSNALGSVLPVKRVIDAAHHVGVPVLVDGAQAVAHARVDVRALGADFYAFSGHKLYAPTGIGVLYGREALLEAMPPWMGGGDMIRTVSYESATWNELPYKFEAGTPNISGAIGLAAAMDFLEELGVDKAAAHEHSLLGAATAALMRIPGVHIHGTAEEKGPVLSFTLEGVHPHDVGTILDHEGVAIRAGHHCAMPLMDLLGLPATARASFACYNTLAEVEQLAAAVRRAAEVFGLMELTELYREVILDHNKHPRNFGRLDPHDAEAKGHNPLCGDRLTITLNRDGERIADLRFEGNGCAISKASASLMTEAVKGKSRAEVDALFKRVHALLTTDAGGGADLGKLAALSGVHEFPARVKCASLAWHTLNAALAASEASAPIVSTE